MYAKPFERKRILITGGTGSLGKVPVRRDGFCSPIIPL